MRTPEWSEEKKELFLAAFRELGYRNKACEKVGIHPTTVNIWVKMDPAFELQYHAAKDGVKEAKQEILEELMFENAKEKKGFLDRIAWLRANDPAKYGHKSVIKHEKPTNDDKQKKLEEKLKKYQKGE